MSSDDETERSGSYWSGYDELWGLAQSTPARKTTFDRGQVVRAAIDIADRDGLSAVTMRTVAHALGTGPMSLYRHVPDKDALVSMMVDTVIADASSERDVASIPDGWRDRLRFVADATWQLCRAHRWYPEASMVRPPLTPSAMAGFEMALSIFDDFDLDIGTKAQFVGSVHSTVLSAALNSAIEKEARSRARLSEAEAFAAGRPFIEHMMASGSYPRVTEFILSAVHLDEEAQMWAGVELILDGISARLAAIVAS